MSSQDLVALHDKHVAGASTFSKSSLRFPELYPAFISKANEYMVMDSNGNCYVDFVSSLGAISIGYNNTEINNAVKLQIDNGNIFSLCSDIEPLCAENICNYTNTDKCMFLKTGTDSTNAAIKLARAYTGKNVILYGSSGYHGWGDWFSISQPINKGIPSENRNIVMFEQNNLSELQELLELLEVAAVIIEPRPDLYPNCLKDIEKLTHDYNALFILDEIVTYPRSSKSLYQYSENTKADLTCISKGIANGYSISVLIGNEDILNQRKNEEVFISGTFFGESIGMIACIKTLEIADRVCLSRHINKVGKHLQHNFNKLALENDVPISMKGSYFRQMIHYPDNDIKSLFLQEMSKRNVLFGNVIFPTYSHSLNLIDSVLNICDEVLHEISVSIKNNNVSKKIIGRKCIDLNVRRD